MKREEQAKCTLPVEDLAPRLSIDSLQKISLPDKYKFLTQNCASYPAALYFLGMISSSDRKGHKLLFWLIKGRDHRSTPFPCKGYNVYGVAKNYVREMSYYAASRYN